MKGAFRALWCVLFMICSSGVSAAPRQQAVIGSGLYKSVAPAEIDYQTWIDANELLMFVTNEGSFAYDNGTLFGKADGLYYPRGTDLSALYAAGIWLGGVVGSDMRVSLAEYSHTYVPGPMAGGTFLPDQPEFKVYKIFKSLKEQGFYDQPRPVGDPEAEEQWDDYHNWPTADGAPVDCDGNPLIIGEQTSWCVFNDADPSAHTNSSGSAQGLGVEIQNTAYAYNLPGPLGMTVFMKYLLINKSGHGIDEMYTSFWADPDLGAANDDVAGADSTLSLGYCYNATNGDNRYGSAPPAVGFCVVQGPSIPAPGDSAYIMGHWRPDLRNLPLTSFVKFINGTDPDNARETYWYMQGLEAKNAGAPIVDPTNGFVTTYMFSGDPALGTGWLDCCASEAYTVHGNFTFLETFGPGGIAIDPPDDVWSSWNSTSEYYCSSDDGSNASRLNWRGHIGEDVWEFRFTPGGSEYYGWNSEEKFPDRAPFEAWNLAGGTDGNLTDTRIQFTILDNDESGGWSPGDPTYFVEREYSEPLPQFMEYTWDDDFRIGRMQINDGVPAEGTIINVMAAIGDTVWDTTTSDIRYMLSSGPFTMAADDTQEVVMAVIVGQGSDRLTSVTALKQNAQALRDIWYACDCSHQGDINGDTFITPLDVVWMINYTLRMIGPPPPQDVTCPAIHRGDWDCNKRINLVDVVRMINYVFRAAGSGPCDPCAECP